MSDDLMMLPAHVLEQARLPKYRKRGHAAPIGSGPEGETCGSCLHLYRNEMAKTYLKCNLMRAVWTGSYGTDVLAKDKACRLWEAKS